MSVASVSRVFSGRQPVSAEITAAVRKASRRLGYRPNRIAQALREKTTHTIGMVVPRISNPFFPALIEAVERELHRAGHGLLLGDSQDDVATEAERIAALLDRRVDGLFVVPSHADRSADTLRQAAAHAPLVQVDRWLPNVASDRADIDTCAAMKLIIDHLSDAGRGRLTFIGAQPDVAGARRRLEAFQAAVRSSSLTSCTGITLGEFSMAWGQQAARELLTERDRPDAVVAGNDLIALGVLQACAERGLAVPDDVAVTGYDDIPFASVAVPSLTTIRQPIEELGIASVRLLLDHLAEPHRTLKHVSLAPQLVVRNSTAGPRSEPPS